MVNELEQEETRAAGRILWVDLYVLIYQIY